MSYHPNPPLHPLPVAQSLNGSPAAKAGLVLLGVGVVGLLVWAAYHRMKLTQSIAEKHGVGHALAFEGGMAAIGALSRNDGE